MNGIVLEAKATEAVILSDDGTVSKEKNNNYEVGQVVIMKEKRKIPARFFASAAGFVAAIFLFTAGAFAYYTPTSYVSLDVNPSIEYSINMFDRVLVVKSVNDDGKEIVFNLDLKNKKIDKAVEETIDKLIEEGFITKDEDAGVIISVSNPDDNKAADLVEKIKENTQSYLDEKGETAQVEADVVGMERVKEARELGVTPGKLNLIEKLRNSSSTPDSIVIEDWLDKPVKEINKTIKDNKKNGTSNADKDDNDRKMDDENEKIDNAKEKEKEKMKNEDKKDSNDDKSKGRDKDKGLDDDDDDKYLVDEDDTYDDDNDVDDEDDKDVDDDKDDEDDKDVDDDKDDEGKDNDNDKGNGKSNNNNNKANDGSSDKTKDKSKDNSKGKN